MKSIIRNYSLVFILYHLSGSLSAQVKTWTLKACIDTAFSRNISLNQSHLNNQINKINLAQSKANELPNLNLSDGQNFNYGYSLDPYTYQYTNQNFASNNVSLNSSVTLFNGYLLINTVKQNKLIYEAGTLDAEKIKNDIMLNVIAGYMQVMMDHDAIDAAQAQVEATNIQVEQTKKFVEFGKVAELNLLQVQSQLASDKLVKVNAENQLQLDKLTLLQLMEMPAANDFDIERQELKDVFTELPVSTDEIDKISESFLPQIKSASLKTNAALFSLKMAENSWLPKLTMTGSVRTGYSSSRSTITEYTSYQQSTVGYLNNDPGQPVIGMVPYTNINKQNDPFSDQVKNNFSQIIGFSLSVPIFNNYQVKNNTAIAKINVMNAQLNEQQTKNDLRKSIETVYTNQVSAGKKLIATEEQMALEKRTYSDMEKKYTFGAIDITSFLIEKNNYNRVSMALIQSKYDYILKLEMVNFYLGKPLF